MDESLKEALYSFRDGQHFIEKRKKDPKKDANDQFRPDEIKRIYLFGPELAWGSELGSVDDSGKYGTSNEKRQTHKQT